MRELLQESDPSEDSRRNNRRILPLILILLLLIAGGLGYGYYRYFGTPEEEPVYLETEVLFGNLSVGITEEGTVEIGSEEQSFTLDISSMEKKSSSSSSSSSSSGGFGGGMGPGGMPGFGSTSTYTSSKESIEVQEVLVSVGQTVKAKDPILRFSEEDVEKILERLQKDVTDTKTELDDLLSTQESDRLTINQTCELSVSEGKYAEVTLRRAMEELQETLTDAEEKLSDFLEEYQEDTESLEEYEEELASAKKNMESVHTQLKEFKDYIFRDRGSGDTDAYDPWSESENANRIMFLSELELTAFDNVYTLTNKVDSAKDNLENTDDKLAEYQTSIAKAKRELQTGLLKAQYEYDQALKTAENAEEIKAVNDGYLDVEISSEQDAYDKACKKLADFKALVQDNRLLAEYDGVVSVIDVEAGDDITKGDALMTFHDESDVEITVTLSETDREEVNSGDEVVVNLNAYPEKTFTATVTEIGDAEYDSSDDTEYYDITVTLTGDTEGIYTGMSGSVTFITRQQKEVIYVSNRAIIREKDHSYVKLYGEDGEIVKREVKTGFSDGTNVEILSGLEEGEIVLIEGKL